MQTNSQELILPANEPAPFKDFLPLDQRTITPELLDNLEAFCFEMIQRGTLGFYEVYVPVTHTFTDNTYVREGIMPKGNIFIGHAHKENHVCVVLKGRMSLLNSDRTVIDIVAPCVFMGAPGRKVVFIHEDVLMQNIHLTDKWDKELFDDVEKMEDHLYNRSAAFKKHKALKEESALIYGGMRALTG